MLRAAQCADGAADRRMHVRARAGNHAGREGGGVELVLRVEDQRGLHRAFPQLGRRLAVQQVQEVGADGIIVRLHLDAAAVVAVVIPVQQHRAEAGHQLVRDVARARRVVVVLLGQHVAEDRHARAHHIHRVGAGRYPFQRGLDVGGQAAQGLQLGLVGGQFGLGRQLAVHQQMGDFLEFAGIGDVQDVVAAIVQVIAAAAHGAKRGIPRGHAGQGDGLLGLGRGERLSFGHCGSPCWSGC
ncbi:hypothetical protein D3C72_877900 [compost metagenome]